MGMRKIAVRCTIEFDATPGVDLATLDYSKLRVDCLAVLRTADGGMAGATPGTVAAAGPSAFLRPVVGDRWGYGSGCSWTVTSVDAGYARLTPCDDASTMVVGTHEVHVDLFNNMVLVEVAKNG